MKIVQRLKQYSFYAVIASIIGTIAVTLALAIVYSLPPDVTQRLTGKEDMNSFWGGIGGLFGLVTLLSLMFMVVYSRDSE